MKTAIMVNRSVLLTGATAALALAAMGFAGSAHARDDVFWSVGVGAPGVSLNMSNAGPVFMQAQPVYVQPEPIYYQPRPVLVMPAPVYLQRQPVYYGHLHGWNRHGGQYVQTLSAGYGAGYYQQDGRNEQRRDDRHEDRRER